MRGDGGPELSTNSTPAWARVADCVAVVLVSLAVVVAMTGGGKGHLAVWRFNVTSALRLMEWAALVAFVRHAAVRRRPIYRTLSIDARRWIASPAFRAALRTTITTRTAIFLVGYFAVLVFGYAKGEPPFRAFRNELLNLPYRWDAGWYLGIARDGYSFVRSSDGPIQQNIVFFPALPMAIRLTAVVLGGSDVAWPLAATLVSLAAFLGGLIYLFLLARDELCEEQAQTVLWMCAAFPFAYFFGAVYTESLFLLGTTGAFYHARREQFGRAGGWALLVGLTRPNGFLLCVPLGLLAISPWLPRWLVRAGTTAAVEPRRPAMLFRAMAVAIMPLVGVLVYGTFVRSLTGGWLEWLNGHAAWGRHYTGLVPLVATRYGQISNAGLYAYTRGAPLDVLNLVAVVFILAAAWPVARRLGLAYGVFILINIVPPLAAGGMLSAGRITSVLFPAFIWLGAVAPPRHRGGWIAAFAANQALNAAIFYTWRELF